MAARQKREREKDVNHKTNTNINSVGLKHFPNIDKEKSLAWPIVFSNWQSKNYTRVEHNEQRNYTKARLKRC